MPNLTWPGASISTVSRRDGVVVYVDKYRGNITGEDHFQGKWTQWIYDLHVRLLSGTTGETVNGAAPTCLWFSRQPGWSCGGRG